MLRGTANGSTPEQFTRIESEPVQQIMPNMFVHAIPKESVTAALKHGVDGGNALDRTFEIPVENWQSRVLNWSEDVNWKSISYAERDPLDHFMTSGHVAYRLRFKTSSRHASLVLNVRHVAMVWCNGQIVGRQIVYSHNAMSAGSMHAVDLHHAGKKRHNLSKVLKNELSQSRGYDEVIILVFSCGQSRAPFLLNDVRNRRGLLSAKLKCRSKVQETQWYIGGVDVTRTDDAYGSSGLALEDVANNFSYDAGFSPAPSLDITADAGVIYFRGKFKTPSNVVMGGSVVYPLRLKVFSAPGVVAILWVNGLLVGRYIADLGPQSDFYVPEGLIKESKNTRLWSQRMAISTQGFRSSCCRGSSSQYRATSTRRKARYSRDGLQAFHSATRSPSWTSDMASCCCDTKLLLFLIGTWKRAPLLHSRIIAAWRDERLDECTWSYLQRVVLGRS
eukprot:IDg16134t1